MWYSPSLVFCRHRIVRIEKPEQGVVHWICQSALSGGIYAYVRLSKNGMKISREWRNDKNTLGIIPSGIIIFANSIGN